VSAIAAAVHISNAPAAMLPLTNCLLRFLSCATAAGPAHPQPTTHIRCYYPTSATNFHNPFLASSSPLSPPHSTKNRIPRGKKNSTLLCPVPKTHKTEKTPPNYFFEIHVNIPPNCNLQLLLSKL